MSGHSENCGKEKVFQENKAKRKFYPYLENSFLYYLGFPTIQTVRKLISPKSLVFQSLFQIKYSQTEFCECYLSIFFSYFKTVFIFKLHIAESWFLGQIEVSRDVKCVLLLLYKPWVLATGCPPFVFHCQKYHLGLRRAASKLFI